MRYVILVLVISVVSLSNIYAEVSGSKVDVNDIVKDISLILSDDEKDNLIISSHEEEEIYSLSGDLIFFARDKSGILKKVVKVYISSNRDGDYYWEQYGIEFLDKIALKLGLNSIQKLNSKKGEKYNILVMSVADGKPFMSFIEQVSREVGPSRIAAFNELKILTEEVGKSYAKLNFYTQKKIENLRDNYQLGKVLTIFERIKEKFRVNQKILPKLDLVKLENCMTTAVVDFRSNPGSFGYTHSDAQPNNVFINSQTKKVTFIDLSEIYKCLDKNKQVRGIPAYEIFQFLSSLNFWQENIYKMIQERSSSNILSNENENFLTIGEKQQVEKQFLKGCFGYIQDNKLTGPTLESLNLFKFYWSLRELEWNLNEIKIDENNTHILENIDRLQDEVNDQMTQLKEKDAHS